MKFYITTSLSLGLLCSNNLLAKELTFESAKAKVKPGETIAVFMHGSDWNKLGEHVKSNVWDAPAFQQGLKKTQLLSIDFPEHTKRDLETLIDHSERQQSIPLMLRNLKSSHSDTIFKRFSSGAYQCSGKAANKEIYSFEMNLKTNQNTLVLDVLGDENNVNQRAGRSNNGNFAISEIEASGASGKITFSAVYASDSEGKMGGYLAVDGVNSKASCWNGNGHRGETDKKLILVSSKPMKGRVKVKLHFNSWNQHSISHFKISTVSSDKITKAIIKWHKYLKQKRENKNFKVGTRRYPAIALFDDKGRLYAQIDNLNVHTTVTELQKIIQEKQQLLQQRNQLWQKAKSSRGEKQIKLLGQALDIKGIQLDKKQRKQFISELKKHGDQYSHPVLRKHLFSLKSLSAKVSKLKEQGRQQQAIAEIRKELNHPKNSMLPTAKKQDIAMQAFNLYREWKGHKAERYDILKEIVEIDPTTHIGIGAQGYLMKDGRGPVSLTWGWFPKDIRQGDQTLSIDIDTARHFYRDGSFSLTLRRHQGKDTVMVKQLSLLVDGKRVAMNDKATDLSKESMSLDIKLSSEQVAKKLSVKVELNSPEGTDHYGKFRVIPVLPN